MKALMVIIWGHPNCVGIFVMAPRAKASDRGLSISRVFVGFRD